MSEWKNVWVGMPSQKMGAEKMSVEELLCPEYLQKDYPNCTMRMINGVCWNKFVESCYKEEEKGKRGSNNTNKKKETQK